MLPESVDKKLIFRLYVSPLLPLNLDNHNRIPTSYLRLLRRIVRDYETRGASVQHTLAMWDSVQRGEKRWIFPYQENADVIFNSSTLYELAVLKKHIFPLLTAVPVSYTHLSDVTVTDLPGIYSLSPYTMEEVVARNYLIEERPDAILNIIDGTNLERNLYLTTQLTELGIPVVIAINMMDIVRKNGDKINIDELSQALGCKVVEISALKGDGVMAAAEAAIDAAKNGKTVPMHTFSCLLYTSRCV